MKNEKKTTHYPQGAEALLIALQTPAPNGNIGIPVLLWGRPGIGKSSFLESLKAENFPVITLIASIHDPTDFSGLPVHHNGMVKYATPEWVEQFDKENGGILFLDELTTAPPAVQSALLRVVLERKVGFHKLDANIRIVAAANPPDMMTGGWALSPPLRNRFVHLHWDLSVKTFVHALGNGFQAAHLPEIDPEKHAALLPGWKLRVAAFLKVSHLALHGKMDESEYGFASPRTWEFVASLLTSCEILGQAPVNNQGASEACLQLIRGAVGESQLAPFIEFLVNLKLPDPEKFLDGEAIIDVSELNDSELYVLFGSLNLVLQNRMKQPDLYKSALHYLDLVQAVFDDARRDVIYVALKEISKAGLLTRAISTSRMQDQETAQEVFLVIQKLFKDDGLMDFIRVFEN